MKNNCQETNLKGLKMLVIDDSKAIREYVSDILKNTGVKVVTVASVKQAISKLGNGINDNKPYHIALVDYVMPDIDGIDFSKMIKSSKFLNETLIIMMTAYPKKNMESELKKEGFSGYLTKPLRVEPLYEMLSIVWSAYKKGEKPNIITEQTLENNNLHKTKEHNSVVLKNKKILLVEDNRTNRAIAEQILSNLGCNVTIAVNGKEAVYKVQENRFDLIFMDCQMPVMDGYEATKIIKAMMKKGDIPLRPIIAFTANATKGDKKKCSNAGMNDYITKPISQDEIKNILIKWFI